MRRELAEIRTAKGEDPWIVTLARFEGVFARNMAAREMTVGEMFAAAFGDDGAAYWRASLLQPMTPEKLAWLVTRHLIMESPSPTIPKQTLLQEDVVRALKEGIAGGSIPTFRHDEPGAQLHIVKPVEAMQWLNEAPMWAHRVPRSLPKPEPPQNDTAVDTEAAYIAHRDAFLARNNGRYPGRDEDYAWGQNRKPKVSQKRIIELRRNRIPKEVRRGGRPRANMAS